VEQTQGGLRYRKEVMAADEMRAAKEGRVYRLLRRWGLSRRRAVNGATGIPAQPLIEIDFSTHPLIDVKIVAI
jgi:hypothetical protein